MSSMLSVLYADDRPVAMQFGLRAANLLHGWFIAYDTCFGKYSPGLILINKMAEECASTGINTIYMGRGSRSYKETMKSYDVFVAEGIVTSRSVLGATHRLRSSSSRWVADAVLRHPNLHNAARQVRGLVRHSHGRI